MLRVASRGVPSGGDPISAKRRTWAAARFSMMAADRELLRHPRQRGEMNINKSVASRAAAGVIVATLALATPLTPSSGIGATQTSASMGATHTHTGPSGNKVEMVDPNESRYVPNVRQAPARSRTKARELLAGVNQFCQSQSPADIEATWRAGHSNPASPTHYFNPEPGSSGLDPANPKAALMDHGRIGGVMFTGQPLPYLGTIPRAHGHDAMAMGSGEGVEMVHVYCRSNLRVKSIREAFTPNRQLGVLADTIKLRLRIRPAVMDLNRRQLRQVRTKIRGYVGRPQDTQVSSTGSGGPDPVLQAMRTEIRESLMTLNEPQLRSVWRLMRSY
jgi:hypothetical protein